LTLREAAPRRHTESATVRLALLPMHLFLDEHGAGRIGTARSEPTMVDDPGALSALRAG
jgi:hypothetical protein